MSLDPNHLRERLAAVLADTQAEAVEPPVWWAGEKAGKQRAQDDLAAGRVHWRAARAGAEDGMAALDAGDLARAEIRLRQAEAFCGVALAGRVRPSDAAALNTSAKKRGGSTADRDRRLADAVDRQRAGAMAEGRAITLKDAADQALKLNPTLKEAFEGAGQSTVNAAYRAGKKMAR